MYIRKAERNESIGLEQTNVGNETRIGKSKPSYDLRSRKTKDGNLVATSSERIMSEGFGNLTTIGEVEDIYNTATCQN